MISREKKIELLSDLDRSTALGAGILFPHLIERPFDPIHKQIFDVIDRKPGDPGYRPRKCVIAPRGVGKTTLGGIAVPTLAILLQRYSYIVIIGYNAGDAIEKTENLKYELENNPLIKGMFGKVSTSKWAEDEYVVQIGSRSIKVHPRGSGQPVRGRNYRGKRPGLVIVDDLEKTEETETELQREKKKSWFYSDVLNCIDRGLKFKAGEQAPWEILVIGTILHHDSLLINLHKSKHWDSVLLEICDDNFVSNAPNFMSDEECKALYLQLKEDDELDVWFRDYRNNPVAMGEDAAFQRRYYQYYDEATDNLNNNPQIESVVIVDPSRTASPSSAPTGIIGVGFDMSENKVYVRDCISRRLHVDEMYNEIADMIVRLEARVLAVEVTGLHEFITHPLKTFLSKRGISIEFIELQARQGRDEKGKAARVRSLVDFYREGVMWHNRRTCDVLEQQLQQFPKATDWSLMDPLGYIVELLEKGERYLSFPEASELEDDESIEREYLELERMYEEEDVEYEYMADDDGGGRMNWSEFGKVGYG